MAELSFASDRHACGEAAMGFLAVSFRHCECRPAELRTLRSASIPDNATPTHSPARQPTGSMPADQGEQA